MVDKSERLQSGLSVDVTLCNYQAVGDGLLRISGGLDPDSDPTVGTYGVKLTVWHVTSVLEKSQVPCQNFVPGIWDTCCSVSRVSLGSCTIKRHSG